MKHTPLLFPACWKITLTASPQEVASFLLKCEDFIKILSFLEEEVEKQANYKLTSRADFLSVESSRLRWRNS